jgi:hypothetical protein
MDVRRDCVSLARLAHKRMVRNELCTLRAMAYF